MYVISLYTFAGIKVFFSSLKRAGVFFLGRGGGGGGGGECGVRGEGKEEKEKVSFS